jgi:opacity protein-like surface antigen
MKSVLSAALVAAALLGPRPAAAVVVTGTLTPAYGPPLVVQTTQTTLDSPAYTQQNVSGGGELDAGYAYVDGDVLRLFLTGNMTFWVQLEGVITHSEPLQVFVDSQPGGQNVLRSDNPAVDYVFDLTRMAGLRFDPGFEADWAFSLGSAYWPTLRAYSASLPTGGGGTGVFLGNASCGGPGALSGGDNASGVAVTLDDSNTGGVTQGCGPSSGAGVTTGYEWAIPLAAIGNPGGCIRVCAFTTRNDQAIVFHQVLGPLPPGTCDLGPVGGVDFGAIAGGQFFTWCPQGTPAARPTWGALKSRYR